MSTEVLMNIVITKYAKQHNKYQITKFYGEQTRMKKPRAFRHVKLIWAFSLEKENLVTKKVEFMWVVHELQSIYDLVKI